jgi:hypothetical protein
MADPYIAAPHLTAVRGDAGTQARTRTLTENEQTAIPTAPCTRRRRCARGPPVSRCGRR